LESYGKAFPDLRKEWDQWMSSILPDGWDKNIPSFPPDPRGIATRAAGGQVMNAIAGHDPRDSTSVKYPVPDYTQSLKTDLNGLKLGIPREYFVEGMQQGVNTAIRTAINKLEELGATVDWEASLPSAKYALAAYYVTCTSEASSNLARFDGCPLRAAGRHPEILARFLPGGEGEGFPGGEAHPGGRPPGSIAVAGGSGGDRHAQGVQMVTLYARAGFTKLHLDASMKLGDSDSSRPLDPGLAARRTARWSATTARRTAAAARWGKTSGRWYGRRRIPRSLTRYKGKQRGGEQPLFSLIVTFQ
jgi:hypothetical protein